MSELQQPTSLEPLKSESTATPRHRHHRRHRTPWGRFRHRLRRINWLIVLLIVAAVVAVAIVGSLVLVTDATGRVRTSWDQLSRTLQTISARTGAELTLTDFDRLQSAVADFNGTLSRARTQTRLLAPLAGLNADTQAAVTALDVAQELSLAANDMLDGLRPTLFFLAGGEEEETVAAGMASGERAVELLRLGRGRFLSADAHLSTALEATGRLNLAALSPDLLLTAQDLIRFRGDIWEINRILLDAPDLLTTALGLQTAQHYLVLSQNSDELRPSGGYVSTYGWLAVRNARIVDYDYSPTTATSPNPPPESLADQVQVPSWWIQYAHPIYAAWDGSWYADFPSTAALAAWYYDEGGNPQAPVDGVLAIDITGFEYLLGALGSVRVPGYDVVVTPENFRAEVYAIRAAGDVENAHKRFVAAMYRQILADWQTVDREQGAALFGAVLGALREKHIMLYFTDAPLDQAVDSLGWSGAQADAYDFDYLMVADANLGNKSNHTIQRQLTYDVEISTEGALHSQLTVSYDYPAREAEADPAIQPAHYRIRDYQNLLQVFVPPNSVLTSTHNLPEDPTVVAGEGRTDFVALTELAYNSGERFQYAYDTPRLVESFGPYRRYRLLLQKQPGMRGEAASVQVRLPPGAQVISTTPSVAASYDLDQPILEFRTTLITDQWIEVIYRQ